MAYYFVLGLPAQGELAYYVLLVELSGFSRTCLANVLSAVYISWSCWQQSKVT
jgi:hypothetical protein